MVGVLTNAQPSAHGRAVLLTTELEGPHPYRLAWDGGPEPDEVATALRRQCLGVEAAILGDIEIDLASN